MRLQKYFIIALWFCGVLGSPVLAQQDSIRVQFLAIDEEAKLIESPADFTLNLLKDGEQITSWLYNAHAVTQGGLVSLSLPASAFSSDTEEAEWVIEVEAADALLIRKNVTANVYSFRAQRASFAENVEYAGVRGAPHWVDSVQMQSNIADFDQELAQKLDTGLSYMQAEVDARLFSGQYLDLSGIPDLADTAIYLQAEEDPSFAGSLAEGLQSADTTSWSAKSDFDGAYMSLNDRPLLISAEQLAKVDSLSLNHSVNLDLLETDIQTNTAKSSFPGFGFSAGLALPILWSQPENEVLLYHNSVRIGDSSIAWSSAGLEIEGGLKLENDLNTLSLSGILAYNGLQRGVYQFLNNAGEAKLLFNGLYHIESGFPNARSILETLMLNHLLVGLPLSGWSTSENILTLHSATPRIRFWDSSNSGSFPSADWDLKGGDTSAVDAFMVADLSNGQQPFTLMAGSSDSLLLIDAAGNAIINGGGDAAYKLTVNGMVQATHFIGSAASLTDLDLSGISSAVQNSGSTTIAADSDVNGDGIVDFQIAETSVGHINAMGNIAFNSETTEHSLSVGGDVQAASIELSGLVQNVQLMRSVYTENASTSVDLTDKDVVVFSNISGYIFFSGMQNGKKYTIINGDAVNQITLWGVPAILALDPYESVELYYNGGWFELGGVY
jgi:hypothetical protein